jgi:hypothetical protein
MRRIYSALVALMLLAAPAAASDGRQTAAAAADAARALRQQAAQIAASGGLLDMTAADASENLRRILDTKSFDELPPVSAADMPWLLDWLGAVRDVNYVFVYSGADPQQPTRLAPEQLQRNVTQYEDEIARVMVFSQKFFPRVIKTVRAFIADLPEAERTSKVRLDGLTKMMSGYLESVEGALIFTASDGTKPANVRMISAALRDSASVWAEVARPDVRKRFAGLIAVARARTKDTATSEHLRAIEGALAAAKS